MEIYYTTRITEWNGPNLHMTRTAELFILDVRRNKYMPIGRVTITGSHFSLRINDHEIDLQLPNFYSKFDKVLIGVLLDEIIKREGNPREMSINVIVDPEGYWTEVVGMKPAPISLEEFSRCITFDGLVRYTNSCETSDEVLEDPVDDLCAGLNEMTV